MPRLASGRRQESYFPIAVADNKFHCIILKGGDQYPYFPRPLLSEFDFSIPLASAPAPKAKKSSRSKRTSEDDDMDVDENSENDSDNDNEDDETSASPETRKLEQQFLLRNIQAAQLSDLMDATRSSATQRAALSRIEVDLDKTLLQLLAVECREGEDRGMRALEMVQLMRDRTGRMIEAAGKVAERYGRGILRDKIREVGERRLAGGDDDGEDNDPFDD